MLCFGCFNEYEPLASKRQNILNISYAFSFYASFCLLYGV